MCCLRIGAPDKIRTCELYLQRAIYYQLNKFPIFEKSGNDRGNYFNNPLIEPILQTKKNPKKRLSFKGVLFGCGGRICSRPYDNQECVIVRFKVATGVGLKTYLDSSIWIFLRASYVCILRESGLFLIPK